MALLNNLLDRLTTPHGIDGYLPLLSPDWTVGEPTDPAVDDAPAIDVGDGGIYFARSGVSAPSVGTLLETAEAAGLTPKNRCRRGICGTCTSTKISGTVRNVLTGDLSTDGTEPIRVCVSVACGEVTVEL